MSQLAVSSPSPTSPSSSADVGEVLTPDQARPFRTMYQEFFDRAEKKRRWNVRETIPWDAVKYQAVSEDLVDVLEAFYATEMYLPDYTAQLLELNRQNHGMAWFITNWGYEESKHSMAIEEWLIRSGRRTPQQMEEFNAALLSEQWQMPFDTSRRMVIYTMLQELATQLNYVNLSKLTAAAGDEALQRVLLLIASDEGCHHKLFVDCVSHHLEMDRAGTLEDIAFVLNNFSMPAHDQIPDWGRRGELIVDLKIYSDRQFVMRVMLPSLQRIGVDRKELTPFMARVRRA
jgi:acyl-[acyl-carrier-protein] desaturase